MRGEKRGGKELYISDERQVHMCALLKSLQQGLE